MSGDRRDSLYEVIIYTDPPKWTSYTAETHMEAAHKLLTEQESNPLFSTAAREERKRTHAARALAHATLAQAIYAHLQFEIAKHV